MGTATVHLYGGDLDLPMVFRQARASTYRGNDGGEARGVAACHCGNFEPINVKAGALVTRQRPAL